MTTSLHAQSNTDYLYMAMELSESTWKLAFSTGTGQKARLRNIAARDLVQLRRELELAKKRFGLPPQAPVASCYEAGRDGFWLHRLLSGEGVENVVVDSSSIEVNRRLRRAKTDRLDAAKLLSMLIRWRQGEKEVWSVVHAPSRDVEDGRRLHRELEVLRREQTRHSNRIKGLLISVGIALEKIDRELPERLAAMRQYDGEPLPCHLHQQLLREFQRMQLANQQIRELEQERAQRIRHEQEDAQLEMVRRLLLVRGIGVNSSWMFVKELFGWRQFANRRQLGAAVGLAPTPYRSGDSHREQGITKGGDRRLRTMLIEIAWGWLRFQPNSRLTRWYYERFAGGGKRQRRIGIVALARKLLIVLWRYLRDGEISDGFDLRERLPAFGYTASLC